MLDWISDVIAPFSIDYLTFIDGNHVEMPQITAMDSKHRSKENERKKNPSEEDYKGWAIIKKSKAEHRLFWCPPSRHSISWKDDSVCLSGGGCCDSDASINDTRDAFMPPGLSDETLPTIGRSMVYGGSGYRRPRCWHMGNKMAMAESVPTIDCDVTNVMALEWLRVLPLAYLKEGKTKNFQWKWF